jgi:hypothetical protein
MSTGMHSDLVPYYNLAIGLLMLIYVKTLVVIIEYSASKKLLTLLQSRKITHIGACSLCFFWNLFNEEHWTWRLNTITAFLFMINFIVKGLVLADPNDPDVKTMTRTGKPIELCAGPLCFACTLVYTGLYQFKTELSTYLIAALIGDGVAPLVGTARPWGRYKSLGGEYKVRRR